MMRTIIAVAGVLLFLVGLILGISLILDALRAASLDETNTIHAAISEDAAPFCTWEASLSMKVMTQNTSQAVLVKVSNLADNFALAWYAAPPRPRPTSWIRSMNCSLVWTITLRWRIRADDYTRS